MNYIDYEIMVASDANKLTAMVKNKMASGWKPIGGVTSSPGPYTMIYFSQAMVLPECPAFVTQVPAKPPAIDIGPIF